MALLQRSEFVLINETFKSKSHKTKQLMYKCCLQFDFAAIYNCVSKLSASHSVNICLTSNICSNMEGGEGDFAVVQCAEFQV